MKPVKVADITGAPAEVSLSPSEERVQLECSQNHRRTILVLEPSEARQLAVALIAFSLEAERNG